MSKKTLFIVEDEKEQLEILSEMLSDTYQIIQASSGLEAIALFREHFFDLDLILLDINLIDMTAYDVFREWENIAFSSIPNVIMVTAYNQTSDMIKSLTENHACFHLGKPFSKKQLLEKIEEALSKPFLNHKTYHLNMSLFIEHWLNKRQQKLLNEQFIMDKSKNQFPKIDLTNTFKKIPTITQKNINPKILLKLLEEDCGHIAPKHSPFKLYLSQSAHCYATDISNEPDFSHISIETKDINTLSESDDYDVVLFKDEPSDLLLETIKKLRSNLFPWDQTIDTKNYKDLIWIAPKGSSRDWIESLIKAGLSHIIKEEDLDKMLKNTIQKCLQKKHLITQLPNMVNLLLSQPNSYRIRSEYWNQLEDSDKTIETLSWLFPDFQDCVQEKNTEQIKEIELNKSLKKQL